MKRVPFDKLPYTPEQHREAWENAVLSFQKAESLKMAQWAKMDAMDIEYQKLSHRIDQHAQSYADENILKYKLTSSGQSIKSDVDKTYMKYRLDNSDCIVLK